MDDDLPRSDFEPSLMPKLRTSTSTWVAVWLQMVPCCLASKFCWSVAPMVIAYIGVYLVLNQVWTRSHFLRLRFFLVKSCSWDFYSSESTSDHSDHAPLMWFEPWSPQMDRSVFWWLQRRQERSTSSLQMLSAFAVWIQWLTRWSLLGPSFWKGRTNGRPLAVAVVDGEKKDVWSTRNGAWGAVWRYFLCLDIGLLLSAWNSWNDSVSPTAMDHRLVLSNVFALHVSLESFFKAAHL